MGTNMQDIQFLSTLSLRRATGCVAGNWPRGIFLSTLSLRRATQQDGHQHAGYPISIHALLAESDWLRCWQLAARDISIHALLAESDSKIPPPDSRSPTFLSTLSLRRATTSQVPTWFGIPNFYPRSPCGERRSVHRTIDTASRFLSTLSLRRATAGKDPQDLIAKISIHALLAESD